MLWSTIVLVASALAHQSASVLGQPAKGTNGSSIINNSCNANKVDGKRDKVVCVCNANACSGLHFTWPQASGEVYLVESSKSGKRFKTRDITGDQIEVENAIENEIFVNLNEERQSIMGWGGTFTDAAGYNLRKLSDELAEEVLQSYFGPFGLQYNFARVPIGGTDFSMRPYTLNESPEPDLNQTKWALAEEDLDLKIPFIKRALEIGKEQLNVDLKLFATPWSPPTWLKDNHQLVRGSLVDKHEIYQSYILYLMKFFDSYEENGIPFWGATVQNEPVASGLPFYFFNSLNFKDNDQLVRFIRDYLGPALEKRGKTPDKFKLMVGDDSLGLINKQVPAVMSAPETARYVSGLAFHWYTSGSVVPYDELSKLYDQFKDKFEFVLMTEACEGATSLKKVDLGNWSRGENYANDIIEDLLRHTNGWIDWNMALNLKGGPNWAKNFADSAIIINGAKNEFYKQPMYYALAHFSRFFKPESVRVDTQMKSSSVGGGLNVAAVHRKETGHVVVNVLNKSFEEREIKLTVVGDDAQKHQIGPVFIEAKSLNSIVLKL